MNIDYGIELRLNELSPRVLRSINFDQAGKDAMILHNNFNQKYACKPYILHLYFVTNEIIRNLKDIPKQDHEIIVNAGWLHDTIEDCKIDWNYIYNNYGYYTANLVKALSNTEHGLFNHKEILKENYARFIKLCDRISHLKSNMSILEDESFYNLENKSYLVNDAEKYLKKYLDQDYVFRKKLKLKENIKPFEKNLISEYERLITKYLLNGK